MLNDRRRELFLASLLKHIFSFYPFMNRERLKLLKEYLKEDPDDPFNWYAVAIEYLDQHPTDALPYFEELLEKHENYVGTYYHAANLFNLLGNKERAEKTYQKGLRISLAQGDRHAHRELQNAYNEFLFEEEE